MTVGIRLHGPVLLSPDTPIVVLGFFASVVPLMAAVTYPVYRWLGVSHTARPAAASLMALPGMVLDVLVVAFAEVVLPALARREVVTFGAILLFGYAVVLLTGYVPARRRH